jgi:hypothetical protein
MSDEDPIRNSCLEPQSLVLTRSECFYCFASEGDKCFTIWDNFGIKTCNIHYLLSIRDCNAYMHRTKVVLIQDLKGLVELKPYLDVILNDFPIKRSSGLIDDGWRLDVGTSWDKQIIQYDSVADDWIIPVKQECSGFIKRLHIKDLMIPEILNKVPPNFEENFRQLSCLCDNGIYKKDYEQYTALVDNNKPINAYEDDSLIGIKMGVSSDGRLARVLYLPR